MSHENLFEDEEKIVRPRKRPTKIKPMKLKNKEERLARQRELRSRKRCLKDFMTSVEVADILGYSKEGIVKAIKENRLTATRKGRQWLVHKNDFEKFRVESLVR